MLKIIGIILLVIVLSIVFIEPLRDYFNNLLRRDKSELAEKQIVGRVLGYNPRVEDLQQLLKDAGFDSGSIDGIMGVQTRKAIQEFQITKGLNPTGKIDSVTHIALIREKEFSANHKDKEKIEQSSFIQTTEYRKNLKPKENTLQITESQIKVTKEELPDDRKKQIQIALQKAGFYKGRIDGKIGRKTRRAIIAFQKSEGLKPDGIVGTKTWNELTNYLKD